MKVIVTGKRCAGKSTILEEIIYLLLESKHVAHVGKRVNKDHCESIEFYTHKELQLNMECPNCGRLTYFKPDEENKC